MEDLKLRQYKQLEIELVYLQAEDVVTASAVVTDDWNDMEGMF